VLSIAAARAIEQIYLDSLITIDPCSLLSIS
jgi:hypothetical protein